MQVLIAKQDTALKKSVADTSKSEANEFINVKAGAKYNVRAMRPVDAGHEFITLDQTLEGKNSWYIFPGHWDIEGDRVKEHHLEIVMTNDRQCDPYGGSLFTFSMQLNGELVKIPMGSGLCGTVPQPRSNDWPGSGNPIPQGVYEIGATVRESEWQMDPRIGPIWIPLTPQSFSGWRDGFLIHMDYNYQRSPGTLGCPFPQRNRDMYVIAEWNDRAKSGTLTVNHGI